VVIYLKCTEYIKTVWVPNAKCLIVRAGGTYTYHLLSTVNLRKCSCASPYLFIIATSNISYY
jgi:hypothetical protein